MLSIEPKPHDLAPLLVPIPEQVVRDYAASEKIPFDQAQLIATEVQKFLRLCGASTESYVPSPAVDAFWHDFILNTKEYDRFCRSNFGRFIHHVPQRQAHTDLTNVYEATVNALRHYFPAVDEGVWPAPGTFLCTSCRKD